MFRSKDFEISKIGLKKLVNFLPYPLVIWEMKQGTDLNLFFNNRFVNQIGYTLKNCSTRMDLLILLYPDENYRNEILLKWRNQEEKIRKKGNGSIKMKVHLCCKSGEKRWFEIKASIVNDLYIVAYVDINSDVMLQEKLKKTNFQNDMMLSIVGHDLRSPVANLIAVSSMAENTDISKQEYVSMIRMIREESFEVLELLDTTFNWARQNFNTIAQKPVEIDFNALLMGVLKSCRSSYENKNITITTELEKLCGVQNDLETLLLL
ncbi:MULTISPECIES: hypothetical protein [Flavobacterium]|uniref:hypothetical protein n=1 Tax=Flavobacterium TaxID=237 RepID=UPI0021157355|nr:MULTISPECIES: hypothetical protein [Flavobacterium]UUF12457.1 hypothetical protein NLJ00_14470 [Flavobacterium panici]